MAYQYYNPYYQPQIQQQMPMQQQNSQQIQTSGFIPVPSEEMARNYPVAPGNSVSFKNENAPYVYTKTMGFSQFDQPIFKKYKLIEEEEASEPVKMEASTSSNSDEEIKSKLMEVVNENDHLKEELDSIKKDVKELKDDSWKIWDEITNKSSKKKAGE